MRITERVPDLQRATEIAASGFGVPLTDELRQDVENHLASGDLVYGIALEIDDAGYRRDSQIDPTWVGFVIFNVWDNILYLGGIILEPEHQGRRMVKEAVYAARKYLRSQRSVDMEYLAFRTQSLIMWRAGSKECESIYPAFPPCDIPEDILLAAREVADRLGSRLPRAEGYYGSQLYGKKPVYGSILDFRLRREWDKFCNFERGDAVICTGRLKKIEWVVIWNW